MLREFFNAIIDAPAETLLMWALVGAAIIGAVIVVLALIMGAVNLFERMILWRLWRVPFITGYFFAFFLFIAIITGIISFYFDLPPYSWFTAVNSIMLFGASAAVAVIGFSAPFVWLMGRLDKFAERRGYSVMFTNCILQFPVGLVYFVAFFGIIIWLASML